MSTFVKFIFAGGAGAIVNILSRYILNVYIPYEYAIIVAYLFGMLTAFVMSKLFVFENAGSGSAGELFRFTIVNLFAIFVVWLVSVTFARIIFPFVGFTYYPEDIAHIIGVCSTAISSYFGHKYFTFVRKSK